MKTEIENQLAIYTERLNTLKTNRDKEFDKLTDEQIGSYEEQIRTTAEFIHSIKKLKSELGETKRPPHMRNAKLVTVVMLATEEDSDLGIYGLNDKLYLSDSGKMTDAWKNQHLYFTSDDEIKEGDYYVNSQNKVY